MAAPSVNTLGSTLPTDDVYTGDGVFPRDWARLPKVGVEFRGMTEAQTLVVRLYYSADGTWFAHPNGDVSLTVNSDGRIPASWDVPGNTSHLLLRKLSGTATPTTIYYDWAT